VNRIAIGLLLAAVGALFDAPGLTVIGVLVALAEWLSTLWKRYGLIGVHYERHLGSDRAVWGDEIPIDVAVWNAKLLPLAWLRTDDFVTEELTVRERPTEPSERPGLAILGHVWSLGPFERAARRMHLVADRRGVFRFGPVELHVADLFARERTSREDRLDAVFVVRPRTVPVRRAGVDLAPPGVRPARRGLLEDPALFAGVRPYQPGDPSKRLHWRATARLGVPVVKRFEPSRMREAILALDVQTLEGPHWLMHYDDEAIESLAVVAASLARSLIGDGAACGLAMAGYTGTPRPVTLIAPRGGAEQLARIGDALGRLAPIASAPYDTLLAGLPFALRTGTTIVSISARDPDAYLPVLRRLSASGYPVRHVALGAEAASRAQRARLAGLEGLVAALVPDWRTSDVVVLAG
jgi:uncharacterized protein (DUF58 family)